MKIPVINWKKVSSQMCPAIFWAHITPLKKCPLKVYNEGEQICPLLCWDCAIFITSHSELSGEKLSLNGRLPHQS